MPDLSVIVVSYNTRELTLACLRSVFEQARTLVFEVLLVDNASADGSAESVAREFPQVRLIAPGQNLGFAAANNLAAEHARGEWLLLLNPDTVVLDRAIDKLLAFAKERSAHDARFGIFGGRTLFPDGSLNPTSCWARPTPWSTVCCASGLTALFRSSRLFNPEAMPTWRRDTVREVDIVTGCFFLLRRSLWQQLGGFDPAFFMYAEEADLCLRARRLGVGCLVYPEATIVHHGGASERVRADKLVRLFKAKAQLYQRHWSQLAARMGILALDLWAWSRLTAYAVASRLRPALGDSFRTWRDVCRRRQAWHSLEPSPPPARREAALGVQ